jgi:hypothetical protein
MAISCIFTPEVTVNGKNEASKLYQEMSKIIKDRPMTNRLYAEYITSNVSTLMDNVVDASGRHIYPRGPQGQHKAKDYLKFIDYHQKIAQELSKIGELEKSIGAVDSNNQRVDFDNSREALEIADDFNNNHSGLVANVYQHGSKAQILVTERNSRTIMQPVEVQQRLQLWELYRNAFNNIGVDIETLPDEIKDVFNANNTALAQTLLNIKNSRFNYLYKNHAQILFHLYANSPRVSALLRHFSSLDEAAEAVSNINHGNNTYTAAQQRALLDAINYAIQFRGIDLTALKQQADQLAGQILSSSPEEQIRSALHKLNKKYHIEINEVHRTTDKIKTLSDAVAEAIFVLERQIREIEKSQGSVDEAKKLSDIKESLLKELANKRYYNGILNMMNEAAVTIQDTLSDQYLTNNTLQSGSTLEIAFSRAKALNNIKKLGERYYSVLAALADEHLAIDESINSVDIDNIRQTAKGLKDLFDKKTQVLSELTESTMVDILTEIIGDTAPDGQSISNIIRMAQVDSSIWDWLYSMGRVSNPIIAAMGSITREAQDSRNKKMREIDLRIRRITDRLFKSGSNSRFMYEPDNLHLISDIDWGLYNEAKKAFIKTLGWNMDEWDRKKAIMDWEEQNTEDRVVDRVSGRTERVPNSNYRANNGMVWDSINHKMTFTPHSNLTKEQQDYYNEMMQIKGEVGTLLPNYAQQQYMAPQLRRNMVDAISQARSAKDVWKAVKNKAQNFYKIREDDTNFNKNGVVGLPEEKRIVDGEEYNLVESEDDNTPLRQIPIFFMNKVEEGELLKDFSSGLRALASTAINYDAMNGVIDVVQFMGDFTKTQMARSKEPNADVVSNEVVSVVKDLWVWGQKNDSTNTMIDQFIAKEYYGQTLDPNQAGYKNAKLLQNLIAYTSFKGLATNVKGAFSNYLVGEYQMMIEAGCGEFYGIKNYINAHRRLFGGAGVSGEIADALTGNRNHKATLFGELFDPINEEFSERSRARSHNSMFRRLIGHDCSFIGYASGEFLIHYVNMYAVLDNIKVLHNGKKISLYDAFELTDKQDGNKELKLKAGVTDLKGNQITDEFLEKVRRRIRYCNQTCHGSMNEEDKGLINQKLWGRAINQFRQWMWEHYSRRFRKSHFDYTLGENREGYWISFAKLIAQDETQEKWSKGEKGDAMVMFMKDFVTFTTRAQASWDELSESQRYNVKRVLSEMTMFAALMGLSFALGEPEDHKKEFWRRWWIYQVRRLILDAEASMPHPKMISSGLTILQSPMAGVNTMNSMLYAFYGITNGDIVDQIKTGKHKGENRYRRNLKKNALPFFKDWEQLQEMSEDESIFQVFKDTPSNR